MEIDVLQSPEIRVEPFGSKRQGFEQPVRRTVIKAEKLGKVLGYNHDEPTI